MSTARSSAMACLILLGSTTILAQTTGSLAGRAADESGGVLPGVSVEAKSSSLQGARVVLTDAQGRYRITLLPPGQYTVVFTLAGFQPESKAGITVGLGIETTLDAVLRPSASAQIVVTGEAPVVDTGSTNLGTNLSSRAVETLPTGRNYSSIVQVVPGISSDADPRNESQATITAYGSSGAENAFYIDGVNTTGIEYGFQGKELNYEFIQEVNVKTGGYEAEFGRSTGAIINVITRSGSNEFHGDVVRLLQRQQPARFRQAGRLDGRHRRRIRKEGLRRGPRRILLEGPHLVLRRLRPRRKHDGQPVRGPAEPVGQHAQPGRRQAHVPADGQPFHRGHGVSGSDGRHGRDQRREPHVERRTAHLRRPPGSRRPRLRPALRGDLRDALDRGRSGLAPQRAQLRGTGDPRGRHRAVPGRVEGLLPDGRLRPDPVEELPAFGVGRLSLALLRRPFHQGRDRVREGRSRRHQAPIGRPARHDLHQHREPGKADLPALLLDDAGRDRRQRSALDPGGVPAAQEHDVLPAGPVGGAAATSP